MVGDMTPRERVEAALAFRTPDVVPLRIFAAEGGLYEHGDKLLDLIKACGHDFGDFSDLALPEPPPAGDFDPDGSYHAFKTDPWGTRWEYRIFGIWGHPAARPLDDVAAMDMYQPPEPPPIAGTGFRQERAAIAAAKETYYVLENGDMLLERLRALRRFEDVLMDLAMDTPEINRMADMVAAYMAGCVSHALALDTDSVLFLDDFGTEQALMTSPDLWRRFFRPRYDALCEPILRAGKGIFFHSCGQIGAILPDLKAMGVDVIWPQLPAYDLKELAAVCRDLGLCIELHPDRGDLMQRGTPDQVRDYILRLIDIFDTPSGGSWLYLEVDPGFPFANVEAMFQTAMELRS